jgi:hypothetical protein
VPWSRRRIRESIHGPTRAITTRPAPWITDSMAVSRATGRRPRELETEQGEEATEEDDRERSCLAHRSPAPVRRSASLPAFPERVRRPLPPCGRAGRSTRTRTPGGARRRPGGRRVNHCFVHRDVEVRDSGSAVLWLLAAGRSAPARAVAAPREGRIRSAF